MYIYICFLASLWTCLYAKNCELKKGKPNPERFWPQNAGRVDESILRWTFFKKLFWTQNVRLAGTKTMFLRNHGTVKDPSGCFCFFSLGQLPKLFAALWSQNLWFACYLLHFGAKISHLHAPLGFWPSALGFWFWLHLAFGFWLWLLAALLLNVCVVL